MPANITIIRAHEFIKATPEGQLNLEESKKLLLEIAAASAPFADYGIILDTRKAQSRMSVGDLWFLAAELSKNLSNLSSRRAQKTAVLCPPEEFDHAAFFALCANNRGFNVSAFTSFEDAYEWLIANGT
jgi:hypothetical protein